MLDLSHNIPKKYVVFTAYIPYESEILLHNHHLEKYQNQVVITSIYGLNLWCLSNNYISNNSNDFFLQYVSWPTRYEQGYNSCIWAEKMRWYTSLRPHPVIFLTWDIHTKGGNKKTWFDMLFCLFVHQNSLFVTKKLLGILAIHFPHIIYFFFFIASYIAPDVHYDIIICLTD